MEYYYERRSEIYAMAAATSQGTTLQGYNNELVKCIEDLREKREELNKLILKDEEDKAKVQKEIAVLTDRLKKVNGKLFYPTQTLVRRVT